MQAADSKKEIPLSLAAAQLRMTWRQAWDALLTGRLRGKQSATGRWRVESGSVEELKRELFDSRDAGRPTAA